MEKRILKNIAINFVGSIVPTFVSLATVPAYLHSMGVDRYAVINLVWALIGYFGVLDLGTSLATENQIAKARAANDGSVDRIFWSACTFNLATGIIGGVIIYFGAYLYIQHGVKVDPAFQREVISSLPWIALSVPLANVTWVFAGAITGVESFTSFNMMQTLGTMLFQVLPLAAIFLFSPSLAVVIPAAVIARVLAGILLGIATVRALKIRRATMPDWQTVRELFRFGRWAILFNLPMAITATIDRMLVGSVVGAREVAYYATPQNLVVRLNILPMAMMRTLFPRLSASTKENADELARSALALLNGVFTPCVLIAILALEPFLTIWLGAPMALACAPVGRLLIIGVWINGQSAILGSLIQAQANQSAVARVSWLQLPLFVGVLWMAIRWFGIEGAAVTVGLKAACDYWVFLYFARLHPRAILPNMLAHLAFLIATVAIGSQINTLPAVIVVALAMAAANVGWSIHTSSELRGMLRKLCVRFGFLPVDQPAPDEAQGS
ncbi:flippase [Paraburkholderia sp.]|uniref:flippase n=1 Tax=Paraburkholderia sp. TaxID=1926495 RepID=UPI0023822407|nr:flippase [Paraburkholderia sp.]MDE1184009.1 flippase [Paraburkholderia sp.]